ncbi:MAG TPA: response regulator transcription factor [Calditrichia bacterium]|nr:response regulator transcription factor [Calditrichia bacterium]
MGAMPIRVLLVEDETILRATLGMALNSLGQMELVGEAPDGRTALKLVKKLRPEVVVMDIHLPDVSGVDVTRQIVELYPGIKVVALSIESDPIYVRNMLSVGAKGYMLKQSTPDEVVHAIKEVYQGHYYICEALHGVTIGDYVQQLTGGIPRRTGNLTAREMEVFRLVAIGHPPKGIADMLSISVKTAEHHRRNLMDKMKVRSLQGLTVLAIQEGIISAKEVLM